jgi:hypothetical protein
LNKKISKNTLMIINIQEISDNAKISTIGEEIEKIQAKMFRHSVFQSAVTIRSLATVHAENLLSSIFWRAVVCSTTCLSSARLSVCLPVTCLPTVRLLACPQPVFHLSVYNSLC